MDEQTNPDNVEQKIREAFQILEELGFPRQQLNERSALTLLSLLDIKPCDSWSDARNPLIGITPMMEYFSKHYGKHYAPNTRETVRRQTIHQFIQAAFVIQNPDNPSRPTNSPKTVYQIESSALKTLRLFGKSEWGKRLVKYIKSVGTLKRLYARKRKLLRIPVTIQKGEKILLSQGGQNILVKKILEDFCSLFTPGGKIIYVGDTQNKWAYYNLNLLRELGIEIEEHGKIPDVVVYYKEKKWLVLIEAVTSHGPVNPKRKLELQELFSTSQVGIVYVTAFLNRHKMMRYLDKISWETEVWVAESPTHLIHFNGERFLGPYE